MTAYENLLQEAYDNNIEVIEFTFKSGIKGLYSDNIIALNKLWKPQQKRNAPYVKR